MEQRLHLLQLPPDEILEEILSYLSSPSDLSSLSKCCSRISKILHPAKQIFLFPECLPFVSNYLQKAEILSLRLVSPAWKLGTDGYLETCELFNNEIYFRRNSPFWPRRSRSMVDFRNAMAVHLLNDLNPFPGRRAAFGRIRREAPDFNYWYTVTDLLRQFGKHLHSVRFDFEDIPFEMFAQLIGNCLQYLPNLKNLHIIYFGRPSQGATTFPSLVNIPETFFLEHLELNGTFPSNFYQQVIQTCHHSLTNLRFHQEAPGLQSFRQLSRLSSLEIYGNSVSTLAELLPNSEYLVSLSIHTVQQVNLHELLDILQIYSSTLQTLNVSFDNYKTWPTVEHPRLLPTFPNMKTLRLENAPLHLLHSLESFPKLKTLDFECLHMGGEMDKMFGTLKIYGGTPDKIYESEVWKVLPHLEKFRWSTYQLGTGEEFIHRYSRQRYEYLKVNRVPAESL